MGVDKLTIEEEMSMLGNVYGVAGRIGDELAELVCHTDYVPGASNEDVFANRVEPGENEPKIKVLCDIKFNGLVGRIKVDDEQGLGWEQLDKSKPIESRLRIYHLGI